ncbi:MAG: hypothetical protein ACJ72D_01635 [Marmoricola sp.]
MKLFSRAERAPELVVAAAGLDRREKVLAFAQDGDRWLLGTRSALHVVEPGSEPVRWGWEEVQAADWSKDDETLTISEVGSFGHQRAAYVFALENPDLLLQLVRERVTASVVLQRGYLITRKTGFKVIGRRSPDGGPIAWMFEYDDGIDPADPAVTAAAADALVRAKADVGEE